MRRFEYIEKKATESGRKLEKMSFEEMDRLWDMAKEEERAENENR